MSGVWPSWTVRFPRRGQQRADDRETQDGGYHPPIRSAAPVMAGKCIPTAPLRPVMGAVSASGTATCLPPLEIGL